MIVQSLTYGVVNPPSLQLNTNLYNTKIGTNNFPTVYNKNNLYCYTPLPTGSIQQCSTYNTQTLYMNNIPSNTNFPLIPDTTGNSINTMSEYIYTHRNDYTASQIGSISIYDATNFPGTLNSKFQYFIHANYSAIHSTPIYQSLMAQAVVATLDNTITIATSIHPLPYTYIQAATLNSYNLEFVVIFVLLAVPWLAASYASYIVREREIKSKHQQLVSGVSIYAYWISTW